MPELDDHWRHDVERFKDLREELCQALDDAEEHARQHFNDAALAFAQGRRELDRFHQRTRRPKNRIAAAVEDVVEEAKRAAERISRLI